MKGFPKNLNTRADYEYVRSNFTKEQYYPVFKDLLATEYDWFYLRDLLPDEEFEEDKTHKVLSNQDSTSQDKAKAVYEYRANPSCRMYALGYTRSEVLSILGDSSLASVGLLTI